jgi:branched-chain amino acid aminotransferase
MIIQKTSASRIDTFDKDNFSFGTTFTDHMVYVSTRMENGEM